MAMELTDSRQSRCLETANSLQAVPDGS